MAGRLVWSRLQAARGLARQPVLRATRRGAHKQQSGNGGDSSSLNTWLMGAAAAATVIATYQVRISPLMSRLYQCVVAHEGIQVEQQAQDACGAEERGLR